MTEVKAYGASAGDQPLVPMTITRRAVGSDDVQIKILYCGICHSDLHQARGQWDGTIYPCVPGHEIVGRVEAVGASVTSHKPGDLVGVGCMVDSCKTCTECSADLEQYCNRVVYTYNGPTPDAPGHTLGGYTQQVVVHQRFVAKVTHKEDQLAAVAPLLCAGITCYSPLRHWKAGPGKVVGIVGIGGLGHMGVKLAHAMGAKVVAFTTSPGKVADAKALGADVVVVSRDEAAMAAQACTIDLIINTVAIPHDLSPYIKCLALDGTMVMVGAPDSPHPSHQTWDLLLKRRSIAGSAIGGMAETQEMLAFCAEHKITSDIEVIAAAGINDAYERMLKSDVKYRFVIDMATM